MEKLKSINEFKKESALLDVEQLNCLIGGKGTVKSKEHYATTDSGGSDSEEWVYDDCGGATGIFISSSGVKTTSSF